MAVAALAAAGADLSAAHGPAGHLAGKPLATQETALERAVAHHRYVARNGRGKAARWHAKALAWTNRSLERVLVRRETQMGPVEAICRVFGRYCGQALAVTRCESGHSRTPRAANGQYLGMFQMGESERRIFGHGPTPIEQARAAWRYFVRSGKDWSPWSCKPY